jgi:4-amino-4-deoxy-L-arabinose transferase-like glycosyltransferase
MGSITATSDPELARGLEAERASAITPPWLLKGSSWVIALALLMGLLLALAIPYHVWDALSFGSWSRLIAQTGHVDVLGPGSAAFYQRPLFYVLQGWTWGIFGVSEALGRLLALAFAVVLWWSTMRLAASCSGRVLPGRLAGILLLACQPVVEFAIAGLTDIPVAALVGACGAVVITVRHSRVRVPAIVVLAALAGLAKPTAFLGLGGVCIAAAVLSDDRLKRVIVRSWLPVAAGAAIAFVYTVIASRHVGLSVWGFVSAANEGYSSRSACVGSVCETTAQLADRVRVGVLLRGEWLGPLLAIPMLWTVIYSISRVFNVRHHRSVILGAAGAPLCLWAGTWLANPSAPSPFVGAFSSPLTGGLVGGLTALMLASLLAPPDAIPSRRLLGGLLGWALPSFAAWAIFSPFADRLLSPAWVPLVALLAVTMSCVLMGAAQRGTLAIAAAALALLGLVAINSRVIDGLGTPRGPLAKSSWNSIVSVFRDGWPSQDHARSVADPELAKLVGSVTPLLRERGARVLGPDGRLAFFFPSRVDVGYFARCSDLTGASAFVLLTNPVSTALQLGGSAAPRYWTACRRPLVRIRSVLPGRFVVFSVEPATATR